MANKATADIGLKLPGTTTPKVTKPSQVPANAATDTGTGTSKARSTTTTSSGSSGLRGALADAWNTANANVYGGANNPISARQAQVSSTLYPATPTVERTTTAAGTGTTGEPFYMGSGITNVGPATQTTATGTPDTVVRTPNGQTYSAPVNASGGASGSGSATDKFHSRTPTVASGTAAAPALAADQTRGTTGGKTYDYSNGGDLKLAEDSPATDETPVDTGGGGSGGGNTGAGRVPSTGGTGAGTPGSTSAPVSTVTQSDFAAPEAVDYSAVYEALLNELDPASIDRLNYYDRQYLVDLLNQEIDAARQQYQNSIDYGTRNAAEDLNRALRDAQGAYQTQQNQIALDERNAMDNSALYAEMRGDDGGIGRAQYDSIQNTAAQNRVAVRQAQSQLTTDTARQIADLRAQGEFQKADAMLKLTQDYLSRLQQIEQFAANYNLTVDQVNSAIDEWEEEFNRQSQQYNFNNELSLANLTGQFSTGTPTASSVQSTNQSLANMAMELLQAGMTPKQLTAAQLGALQSVYGMDASELNAYYSILAAQAAAANASRSSGSRSSSGSAPKTEDTTTAADNNTVLDQINGANNAANGTAKPSSNGYASVANLNAPTNGSGVRPATTGGGTTFVNPFGTGVDTMRNWNNYANTVLGK